MLRSLIAILVASIFGLASAKFIESSGKALFFGSDAKIELNGALPAKYYTLLLIGWLGGAFIASVIALLVGVRWAPLGILAATTVLLSATLTIMTFSLHWALFPSALLAISIGGFAAHHFLKPDFARPVRRRKQEPFYD